MVEYRLRRAIETATVARLLSRSGDSLTTLARSSRTVTLVTRLTHRIRLAWRGSQTDQLVRQSTATTLSQGSTVVAGVTAVTDRVGTVATQARPGATCTQLYRWSLDATRSSFLYRWLTAEPDPEVIVIDLRETWTAGPVIAGIDRTLAELAPGVESATITGAIRATSRQIARAPIRYLSMGLLGLVAASLVGQTLLMGPPSTTLIIGHLAVALLAAGGVRVTASATELRESRLGRWLADAFEPPEPPDIDE